MMLRGNLLSEYYGRPSKYLFLGGTGTGKTSLLSDFLKMTTATIQDRFGDRYDWRSIWENSEMPNPKVGNDYTGTTKEGSSYHVLVEGLYLILIDLPGIGDRHIKPVKLMEIIKNITCGFLVHGIIVVASYGVKGTFVDPFLANLLTKIIPVKADASRSIILALTHGDRAFVFDREDYCWSEDFRKNFGDLIFNKSFPLKNLAVVSCTSCESEMNLYPLISILLRGDLVQAFKLLRPNPDDLYLIFSSAGFDKPNLRKIILRYCKQNFWGTLATASSCAGTAAVGVCTGATAIATGGLSIVATGVTAVCAYGAGGFSKVITEATSNLASLNFRYKPPNSYWEVTSTLCLAMYVPTSTTKWGLKTTMEEHARWWDDSYQCGVFEEVRDKSIIPAGWVCSSNRLYIGLRGSIGTTDWMTNINANPTYLTPWNEGVPEAHQFGVHTGMMAKAHIFITENAAEIARIVEDFSVSEIILTGHSLGGGHAQIVARLIQHFQEHGFKFLNDEIRVNEKLRLVQVRALVYASPMVFCFRTDPSKDVLSHFVETRNAVFAYDLIPCMPKMLKFGLAALEKALEQKIEEKYPIIFTFMKPTVKSTLEKLKVRCDSLLSSAEREVFSKYRHVGRLLVAEESSGYKLEETSALHFGRRKFKDTGLNVMDFHSVFPSCLNEVFWNRRFEEYNTELAKAGAGVEKKDI